jgi:single-strand DNA-binding protein
MYNNVTLIGYLGTDAESRPTRNNSTLTILSLATKRTWKNRETGTREAQTTWHKCVFFGRTAEYAAGLAKAPTFRLSVRSRHASTLPRTARRNRRPRSAYTASPG